MSALTLALVQPLTDEEIVEDAIAARAEAEATEAEASPSRWREADDYVELSMRGWTQQRIAEECRTNQSDAEQRGLNVIRPAHARSEVA